MQASENLGYTDLKADNDGFNFIVFTTNLVLADYAIAVSSFMLATVAALIVDNAMLVGQHDAAA